MFPDLMVSENIPIVIISVTPSLNYSKPHLCFLSLLLFK